MPVMAYCKKCKQEVEPASLCSLCGQKLPAGSLRISWIYTYSPVREFLSWNSILRVGIPSLVLLMLMVTGVELSRKGMLGVQVLFAQGFASLMLTLFTLLFAAAFLSLLARGRVHANYVLDQKGIHVRLWQDKTSLLLRILHITPGKEDPTGPMGEGMRLLEEKHLPYAFIKRVGVWPDRDKILLYNPRFFQTQAIHCLPDTYDDCLRFLYEQVKKRPGVMQPPHAPQETEKMPQL